MLWGSAYGAIAFTLAQQQGFAVPEAEFARLQRYLSEQLRGTARERSGYGLSDRCLAVYALALAGKAEPAYHDLLFQKRAQLSAEDRALVALAVIEAKGPRSMIEELLRGPATDAGYVEQWFGSVTREHALQLLAWTRHAPKSPRVDQLALELFTRRENGHWGTTQSNAWALISLANYLRLVETGPREASGEVRWPGASAAYELDQERIRVSLTFPLEGQRSAQPLMITRHGGKVYAETTVTARSKLAEQPRQDQGYGLTRRYAKIGADGKLSPAENLRVGDRILVTLEVEARRRATFLALEDPLPSVLAPINPAFKSQETLAGESLGTEWVSDYSELRDGSRSLFCRCPPAGSLHPALPRARRLRRRSARARGEDRGDVSSGTLRDDGYRACLRAGAAMKRLLLGTLVLPLSCWLALRFLPLPAALVAPPRASTVLLDRNGLPLREARTEEHFRRELTAADLPAHVVRAIIAAEDKRFFAHHGVDGLATARALANGLTHGHITSGASTITQQLVKISQRRPRTLLAKVVEALTALRLEQVWSKEQILAAYLNRVDFGNLNLGLAAAADYYFGKPVSDLSEAEAALLAGLPRNPRKLNPQRALPAAQKRQQLVLRRMHENGWLSRERWQMAAAEPLHLRPPRRRFRAPHFTDLLLNQPLEAGAGEVRTTLDLPLNEAIERLLQERLAQLREQNVRNGAAVVLDNASGDVLALVGSADYFAPGSGQVNGAWAKRSAGSTLKPFTYLLALERGATPATIVADVRASFPAAGGFYRPENYNRRCYGPVTYRTALASSLNIPAVKVLQANGGPAALAARLQAVGLTSLEQAPEVYGLGLTLGNCEGRLLEIANAYASLARLGEYRPWRLRADAPTFTRRYTRPELAWQIADILSDNAARTLSFGIHSALRFDFPVACKTGTSTDFRDNWAIGYTPEFTVGVWVGNFDGAPMHEVSGVTGAGPILHAIFEKLHAERGTSWYAPPAGLVERQIDPLTGKVLAENAAGGVREKFVAGQRPGLAAAEDYDAGGRVKLPADYADWFASAENFLGARAVLGEEFRIVSPLPDAVYLLDPDVPSSRRIPLGASGGEAVRWESASLRLTNENGRDFALGEEGEHRLSVTDTKTGQRREVRIRVRAL